MSDPTNEYGRYRGAMSDPVDECDVHFRDAMSAPMHEFALHEDELLYALEELAEIVEIICAPIMLPTLATTTRRRDA
jgi:hypothetical protein